MNLGKGDALVILPKNTAKLGVQYASVYPVIVEVSQAAKIRDFNYMINNGALRTDNGSVAITDDMIGTWADGNIANGVVRFTSTGLADTQGNKIFNITVNGQNVDAGIKFWKKFSPLTENKMGVPTAQGTIYLTKQEAHARRAELGLAYVQKAGTSERSPYYYAAKYVAGMDQAAVFTDKKGTSRVQVEVPQSLIEDPTGKYLVVYADENKMSEFVTYNYLKNLSAAQYEALSKQVIDVVVILNALRARLK
jgi:hypothetical protein